MNKETKQRLLLGILVLALGWLGWRMLSPLVVGAKGGSDNGRQARRAVSGVVDGDLQLPEVVDLNLEALEAETGQFSPDRDPFRFGAAKKPPSPPPDPAAESALRRAMREASEREQRERMPAQPPAPRPPTVDVVFLGSFGPVAHRLAVFSDGSQIYNVLEGDLLNEKFVVVKIGFESADIGFVGFPDAPAQRLQVGDKMRGGAT